MKLSEIRKAIGAIADVTGEDDLEIRYLLTDSRELEGLRVTGQASAGETLFFAIKTDKDDGANYIPELREKGVRAFVTGDSIAALQALAAYVRAQFKGTVIGITDIHSRTLADSFQTMQNFD